jgi:hypothetical protein
MATSYVKQPTSDQGTEVLPVKAIARFQDRIEVMKGGKPRRLIVSSPKLGHSSNIGSPLTTLLNQVFDAAIISLNAINNRLCPTRTRDGIL